MMLTPQKHLFDLDDSITYLNGAYMSPQLKSVTAAGVNALGMKSNPQQIHAADFFSKGQELQEKFALLIDAPDPRNIAIIPSASYGIANAANNLKLNAGRRNNHCGGTISEQCVCLAATGQKSGGLPLKLLVLRKDLQTGA